MIVVEQLVRCLRRDIIEVIIDHPVLVDSLLELVLGVLVPEVVAELIELPLPPCVILRHAAAEGGLQVIQHLLVLLSRHSGML